MNGIIFSTNSKINTSPTLLVTSGLKLGKFMYKMNMG